MLLHPHTLVRGARTPPPPPPPHRPPPRPAPPCLQRKCGEVLESRAAHYTVIGLVLLDLAIVVTELALSSFYPVHDNAPHAGEGSSTMGCAILAATSGPPPASRGAFSRPARLLACQSAWQLTCRWPPPHASHIACSAHG